MNTLMIGWTSVDKHEVAMQMAKDLVDTQLAACIQVDGPVNSVYKWMDKVECETEYRLMLKFMSHNENNIQQWLQQNHPYDTPQWYALMAEKVAPSYLKWAEGEK